MSSQQAREPGTGEQIPFGPYSLLRSLGKGGMAEVFLARAEGPGGYARLLAIKRLLAPFAASDQLVSMMADEARLSVWLNHPSIVQVLDFGRVESSYYIALEFVDGCDLCKLVRIKGKRKGRPLPLATALYVIHQVAEALDYAHRRTNSDGEPLNIIHRDVSPHNVLISREGQVKLADFGLARASISVHESHAGVIRGKFAYMPKEQANGREIDHRIDIFAAGATLYEALTGVRPYSATNLAEQLYQLEQRVPVPSTHIPDIPPEIDDLTMQALSPDLQTRYQTAEELANDLRHALAKLSTPSQEAQQLAALVKSIAPAPAVDEAALRPDLGDLPQDCSLIGDAINEAKKARALHVSGSALEVPDDAEGEAEEHDTLQSMPDPSMRGRPPDMPTRDASMPGPGRSTSTPSEDSELSVPTIARRLSGKQEDPAPVDPAGPARQAAHDDEGPVFKGLTSAEFRPVEQGDNDLRPVHGSISQHTRLPEGEEDDDRAPLPRRDQAATAAASRPKRPRPARDEIDDDHDLVEGASDPLDDAKTIQREPEEAKSSIRRALERRQVRPRARTGQVSRAEEQRRGPALGALVAGGVSLLLLGVAAGWLAAGSFARGPCPSPRPCPAAAAAGAVAPTPAPVATPIDPPREAASDAPPVVIVDAGHAGLDPGATTPKARRARPRRAGRRAARPARRQPRRPRRAAPDSDPQPARPAAAGQGWLRITAGEKALVFIEGRLVGPAPLARHAASPGIFRVKVLFTADREYSSVKFVTVQAGRVTSAHFTR